MIISSICIEPGGLPLAGGVSAAASGTDPDNANANADPGLVDDGYDKAVLACRSALSGASFTAVSKTGLACSNAF